MTIVQSELIRYYEHKRSQHDHKDNAYFQWSVATSLVSSAVSFPIEPSPSAELPYEIGVCIGHCCLRHGCKYGKDDCAVEKGVFKQEHPCEYCEYDPEPRTITPQELADAYAGKAGAHLNHGHIEGLQRVAALLTSGETA